jgi:hypothetical protein
LEINSLGARKSSLSTDIQPMTTRPQEPQKTQWEDDLKTRYILIHDKLIKNQ